MQIQNSTERYGVIAIVLHWVVALTIIAMFVLGLWMVTLDYYSEWYRLAPYWHKSVGLTLLGVMLLRALWRRLNPRPQPEPTHSDTERKLAHYAHIALYSLVFMVMLAGYFISTADGRAIEVFNWFEVPALISGIDGQEDIAGSIHWVLAILLISLSALHALAALKHHFVDKDNTLKKMTGRR